jgi:DNA polymerase sigma
VPTSDIDIVITESHVSNIPNALKSLANVLSRKGVATKVQVRST